MPGDTQVASTTAGGREPTVLASWTRTLVRTLDAAGHDGIELACRAGIDPDLFDVEGARLPMTATSALWQLAVDATGDPCIGLRVARHVRPTTFHGLSVGVVSSGRFRDALTRVVRYNTVVCTPTGQPSLTEVDGRLEYVVSWPPGSVLPRPESMEAILACIVRAGRFLLGHDLSPCSVELMRPARPAHSRFEPFFDCPIHYGSARYLLAWPLDAIDRSLPTGCDELASNADRMVSTYLERIAPGAVVTDEVRQAVADLLADGGVSSSAVASRLAMSARTMQRRLRDEGTSFRDVVTDVRVTLAKRAIEAGTTSVPVLADRLGFSDAAAFRRAFKRVTGLTPGAYATAIAAGGAPTGPD
jgi:AraC-like DNA-binding protein